jgi:hypothetical protein
MFAKEKTGRAVCYRDKVFLWWMILYRGPRDFECAGKYSHTMKRKYSSHRQNREVNKSVQWFPWVNPGFEDNFAEMETSGQFVIDE